MVRWNEEECRTVQDDGMCIGECDMCYSDREWKENEMIDKKDLAKAISNYFKDKTMSKHEWDVFNTILDIISECPDVGEEE